MSDVISSTDDYLSLLLDRPDIPPLNVLAMFFLMLARILPIIAIAPFLGGRNLPNPLKIMLSISLIAIMLPHVLLAPNTNLTVNWHLGLYLIKEVFVGILMGTVVAMPFYIAQSSGTLIDHMRGSASLQVTDPTTQSQTGVLGILYNLVLIAVYYIIGGPFLFFDALAQSFELIPIDHMINPLFFTLSSSTLQIFVHMMTIVMSLAIQLAAPALIGILMAEMFLGIANRLAPQVQIVFLGISLKSWMGLALLALSWGFILQQLSKESLSWVEKTRQMVYEIHPFTKKG